MKQTVFVLVAIFAGSTYLKSQIPMEPKKSPQDIEYLIKSIESPIQQSIPLAFTALPKERDLALLPNLKKQISENESEDDEALAEFKNKNRDLKGKIKTEDSHVKIDHDDARNVDYEIGYAWYASTKGGCPNDNSIAIGKSGRILNMTNQEAEIFTRDGTKIASYTLDDFFENKIDNTCDPKVEYDQYLDRYFIFAQDCDEYPDNICFGFSVGGNPNGYWHYYIFNTDPFGEGLWSDYPKVAFTADEIFVSLNLFKRTGGYEKSVIYQLDKNSGYNGQSLQHKIWDAGSTGTILPINSGIVPYTQGAYAIATHAGGGSSFYFMDLTQNLGNANAKLNIYEIPVTPYEPPSDALQSGSDQRVSTGDSRCQSGFYQNGKIHFVHTVSDAGYSALRYIRYDPDKNQIVHIEDFSKTGEKDYCYPSIAPFTKNKNDDTAIIHFQASGEASKPEIRAVVFNHDFTNPGSGRIRMGTGHILACYNESKKSNRWGDYTGIAIDYSKATPTVWVAGSIASFIENKWQTFVAELKEISLTQIDEVDVDADNPSPKVYPIPAANRVSVALDLNKPLTLDFNLYDSRGNFLKQVYQSKTKEGKYEFSFDVSSLQDGIYLLHIKSANNEIIKTKKIIVDNR